MKQKLLYVSFILITNYVCFSKINNTKVETENYIIWTIDRKLIWKDFKSKEKIKRIGVAQTGANIEIKPFKNKFKKYDYKVLSTFYKNKSWTQTESVDVLEHEQLHFDIAELFARKMRKEIAFVKLNNKVIRENDYRRIHQLLFKKYLIFQNKYDKETMYSKNTKIQKEWIDRIAIELQLLKNYNLKI